MTRQGSSAHKATAARAAEQDDPVDALRRCREEFADIVHAASHDLREPARGIRHYASFMKEDFAPALDEEGMARLDAIIAMSVRLEKQIDGLRAVFDAGQAEPVRQATDMHALVAAVAERLSPEIDLRGACVHIDQMPVLDCDPKWTSVLMDRLIRNAIVFNDSATPTVNIGSKRVGRRNSATLFVRDNGIGVENRHHEEIFKLFRRLHPVNTYGDGPGAGLTVARKIVERHHGALWLEPAPGCGTTVCFTLDSGVAADTP